VPAVFIFGPLPRACGRLWDGHEHPCTIETAPGIQSGEMCGSICRC
jgi:hypothetical protein